MGRQGSMVATWVLAGIALVQVGYLGVRYLGHAQLPVVSQPLPTLQGFARVGDIIPPLRLSDTAGVLANFSFSESPAGTILFVYRSDCTWCSRVAPAWREWMKAYRGKVRLLAISTDSVQVGTEYADDFHWVVPLAFIPTDSLEQHPGLRLVRRTPWLFIVAADGTVAFEAQGNELAELDVALQRSPGKLAEVVVSTP